MGVHPNIHIPKESFPHWIWYAIEMCNCYCNFLLISRELLILLKELPPEIQNYVFIGISWNILFNLVYWN